jgi:Zn-dependent protease
MYHLSVFMAPEYLAFSIVILIFSVIIHEVMHGWVALKFGDHTAENAGRLTLNPIPHIDPIGTILLPALLFITNSPIMVGWAKPVPVNPLHFTDIRRGELLVSAAGILSNLGLAIIAAILFHSLGTFTDQIIILRLLEFTVTINLLLAVFNLIPIPPLDGSKILISQLPLNLAREYQKIEPYSFIFLILLWLIPVGNTSLLSFILGTGTALLKTLLGF